MGHRNWHVVNATNCPEVTWSRSRKTQRIFFYKATDPQTPIGYADKLSTGGKYRLCKPDGSIIDTPPNILACQIALRDRI